MDLVFDIGWLHKRHEKKRATMLHVRYNISEFLLVEKDVNQCTSTIEAGRLAVNALAWIPDVRLLKMYQD